MAAQRGADRNSKPEGHWSRCRRTDFARVAIAGRTRLKVVGHVRACMARPRRTAVKAARDRGLLGARFARSVLPALRARHRAARVRCRRLLGVPRSKAAVGPDRAPGCLCSAVVGVGVRSEVHAGGGARPGNGAHARQADPGGGGIRARQAGGRPHGCRAGPEHTPSQACARDRSFERHRARDRIGTERARHFTGALAHTPAQSAVRGVQWPGGQCVSVDSGRSVRSETAGRPLDRACG